MSKINDLLITEAENYISGLLTGKLPERLIFHNFSHAMEVGKNVEILSKEEGVSEEDVNLLRICVLFQDAGYVNSFENHIEESVNLASGFLAQHAADQHVIDRISNILMAQKPDQEPQDPLSGILADAGMMFFTAEGCLEQMDMLYDESALLCKNFMRRSAFEKQFVASLEKHICSTEYGKTVLQSVKETMIRRITDRMKRRKMLDSKKESDIKKKLEYSRGVDTMLRITARNQINLNSIADNKSNILISVNAIIISIIITMLAGNIGNMSQDIIPIIVLLVICLATIVIAILSTRPNIITSKFTREDLRNKNVDLTFFGNFIKLDYDDYLDSLKSMMADEEHLYSSLVKNQYSLGKILSKKFRLVRIAYNVFMFGIIFTVLVFLLNYLIVH